MATVYPTLAEVRGFFEPIVGGVWMTEDGMHLASVEPFMGSTMLVWTPEDYLGQMVPAIGAGVMLPAIGAARDTAMQMQGLNHARQLMMAGNLHANEHNSKYPGDLAELAQAAIDAEMADPSVWTSPYDRVAMPEGFAEMQAEDRAAWLRANSAFCVVPGMTTDDGWEQVVLFGRPSKFDYGRVPVGYADGRVELLSAWQADEVIRLQTNRTIYDWDESMMGDEVWPVD
jgi:hypothetical protein